MHAKLWYLKCRCFLELSLCLRDDESETGGLPGWSPLACVSASLAGLRVILTLEGPLKRME